MKRQKIIIYDTFSTHHFHETFNAAFVLSIQNAFPDNKLMYYADESSIKYIKEIIEKNDLLHELENVTFYNLWILKGGTSVSIFFRFLFGQFINLKSLWVASEKDIIIFNNNNPFFLWLINFLLLFLKRNVRIVCHGELEYPIQKAPFYKPLFIYRKLIFNFFNKVRINPRLTLIILGEHISKNLLEFYPRLSAKSLLIIDHPYIFSREDEPCSAEVEKLVLGTVGALSISKGYKELIRLVEGLKEVKDLLQVNVVGLVTEDIKEVEGINFLSRNGKHLDINKYNEAIQKLDYVLFFYPKHSYRFVASGALFDVINYEKPIIALRNQYFEEIFKKTGKLGYLCDSVQEMQTLIFELSSGKRGEEFEFILNLKRAKKHFGFLQISTQLA